MSWQAYVDDHLLCEIEGNHLSSAAIIGHDGSVWAQSANFPQLKPEEITATLNDFNEPGSLAPTGLYLGGTKYMVIQGEPGAVIRGKKLRESSGRLFRVRGSRRLHLGLVNLSRMEKGREMIVFLALFKMFTYEMRSVEFDEDSLDAVNGE